MSRYLVTLLNDLDIEIEEQERVKKVVKELNITDNEIQFYLKSFQHYDRNKDNTISTEELPAAIQGCGLNPTQKEVQRQINRFDLNHSGKIELSEFMAMTKAVFEVHDASSLQRAFDKFDINRDGYINVDELREVLTTRGEPLTDQEYRQMIAEADIDGDNRIDIKEFILNMKRYDVL